MADDLFNIYADRERGMGALREITLRLPQPKNYYLGLPSGSDPLPQNILLFHRQNRGQLQSEKTQPSSHHRFVLILNLQTPGDVLLDRTLVPLAPGHALLVFPFQFHSYANIAAADMIWLFITFELQEPETVESLRYRPLPLSAEAVYNAGRLAGLFASLHDAQTRHGTVMEACCRLQLMLESFLGEAQTPSDLPPLSRQQRWVERVNRAIRQQVSHPFSLPELAASLHISPSHLRNQFRQQTGQSLGAYLRRSRMHHALTLLRDPEKSVTDIAEACGYNSLFAFSRAFRAEMGSAPSAYRKPFTP